MRYSDYKHLGRQFAAMARNQQVNDFGRTVQHLKDTGNTDELARLAGILDESKTSLFLFDEAEKEGFTGPATSMWIAEGSNPDTAHISLSDSGVESHNSIRGNRDRWRSPVPSYDYKVAMRERLQAAENRRAVMAGFDRPPSGPPRNVYTGRIDRSRPHSPNPYARPATLLRWPD